MAPAPVRLQSALPLKTAVSLLLNSTSYIQLIRQGCENSSKNQRRAAAYLQPCTARRVVRGLFDVDHRRRHQRSSATAGQVIRRRPDTDSDPEARCRPDRAIRRRTVQPFAGRFPAAFKEASVTPILKKAGLDSTDVSSYRPISNLSVLSKLLERLVVRQLMEYLTSADLLPSLQSGFRPGHSTETAVLHVLSNILQAVDRGDVAALTLLDLSAAFDTVDHDILVQRLHTTFGFDDVVLRWFRSYLSGRSQYVRRDTACQIVNRSFDFWSTAGVGFGTGSVHAVHRRPDFSGREPRSVATSLRGRHSNMRRLSTRRC